MKCPKCGHDNSPETLFCDECDWRTDQPYRPKATVPRIYFALLAAVLGLSSLLMWYLEIAYGAIGLGAIGMVLGGHSTAFIRITNPESRVPMMVLAMVGILTSVIGFMLGLTLL